jgi:hypothetical protein
MPHRPNGQYVSNADALTAWTPAAREVLLETARTYHAVVAPEVLAARVQESTGISTDQEPTAWIGRLRERVAADAQRRDEPPLAALCPLGSDDDAAAEDRLRCYREYALDLPADGGVPARVRVAPVRRETRARSSAPRPRPSAEPRLREVTCTSCFMIVAVRETCSSCGAPLPA